MEVSDIKELVRFFDKRINKYGVLVLRKYHQTNCWMMLYDDGTIEELGTSDLKIISEVK